MVTVFNGASSLNGHVLTSCPPAPPPPPRHPRCTSHIQQHQHHVSPSRDHNTSRTSRHRSNSTSPQHHVNSPSPSPHHHNRQSPNHASPHHDKCPQRPHSSGRQLLTSPNPLPTADKSIVSQKGTVRGVKNRVRSNIQNIKDRTLNPNAKVSEHNIMYTLYFIILY